MLFYIILSYNLTYCYITLHYGYNITILLSHNITQYDIRICFTSLHNVAEHDTMLQNIHHDTEITQKLQNITQWYRTLHNVTAHLQNITQLQNISVT